MNEKIRLKKFNQICKDIKSIKIQGAENIAKKAFYAYKLVPNQSSKLKLISLRPTEPMLINLLKRYSYLSYNFLIKRLEDNQDKINKTIYGLIKKKDIVFVHCHSSTVILALIYSKKKGKNFEVYATETRPLFQGRKTAKELSNAKIKVTMFVDSAASTVLNGEQGLKKPNLLLFGADAITKKGAINKIGSNMFADIAKKNKIPVYIVSDSLKYFGTKIKIEERDSKEVFKTSWKIKIRNPAFELVKKKYITGIISEFGVLSLRKFRKRVKGKIL
jgi:translation initiation factor 2B subunit (eIF-2B alpha/beta/delta family)